MSWEYSILWPQLKMEATQNQCKGKSAFVDQNAHSYESHKELLNTPRSPPKDEAQLNAMHSTPTPQLKVMHSVPEPYTFDFREGSRGSPPRNSSLPYSARCTTQQPAHHSTNHNKRESTHEELPEATHAQTNMIYTTRQWTLSPSLNISWGMDPTPRSWPNWLRSNIYVSNLHPRSQKKLLTKSLVGGTVARQAR